MDSSVSYFEDRETIKSEKMSKVSSKKLTASVSKDGIASRQCFPYIKLKALIAKDEGLLQSKELLSAWVVRYKSF